MKKNFVRIVLTAMAIGAAALFRPAAARASGMCFAGDGWYSGQQCSYYCENNVVISVVCSDDPHGPAPTQN